MTKSSYTKRELMNAYKKGHYTTSEMIKAINKERSLVSKISNNLDNLADELKEVKGQYKKLH